VLRLRTGHDARNATKHAALSMLGYLVNGFW
jgi:hypothetical protein